MPTIKFCLDCDREIDLGSNPKVEQRVTCPHCGVKLEIINIDPLELDWVYDGPVTDPREFDDWWNANKPNVVNPKI